MVTGIDSGESGHLKSAVGEGLQCGSSKEVRLPGVCSSKVSLYSCVL